MDMSRMEEKMKPIMKLRNRSNPNNKSSKLAENSGPFANGLRRP